MIGGTRQHEQQIRQAIHVANEHGVDWRLQPDDAALGSATDGARDVQGGAGGRAARENEAAQRRQLGLEPIDQLLEPLDVGIDQLRFRHAIRNLIGRVRELRAEGKEIALKANELGGEPGVQIGRAGQAEPRVRFIDLAVRVDARIVLGDTRAVEERRLASIARPRVEFPRPSICRSF